MANLSGKIIVASHPTFIDIVILIGLIPNSTCLAKKDTLKNPLFRNIVKSIYIINDIDLDDFKTETDKFLKEGFNIIIFPTGTRTKPDEDIIPKVLIHRPSIACTLRFSFRVQRKENRSVRLLKERGANPSSLRITADGFLAFSASSAGRHVYIGCVYQMLH